LYIQPVTQEKYNNVIEVSDEEPFAKAKALAICESTWNGDPVYRNDRQERRLPFWLRRRFNARDGNQSTEVYLKMEASGMNQWKIGEVKITRVVESEGPWDGSFILPDGTAETVRKEARIVAGDAAVRVHLIADLFKEFTPFRRLSLRSPDLICKT
jgi:hypothetical protein